MVYRDGLLVEAYRYDDNGNRLEAENSLGVVAATYDAQDRLLTYGDATFTHTPEGDLLTREEAEQVTRYTHNALGELVSVELPSGMVVSYLYDPLGQRIAKVVDGVRVQGFLHGGWNLPVAEFDSAGNVVTRFIYGTQGHVPDYMERGGRTYALITDHVGSVRLVVDADTGEVAQRLGYDTYGNVLADTNPGFQPFGYGGGRYDPDTGLVHFGYRNYDPGIGRWITKDPMGLAVG